MKTGTVKWFNTSKGYGFILGEDGKDIFVHFKDVKSGVTLNDGDPVQFDVEQGKKGLQATNVQRA